jgi:hypothetical protein
MSEKELIGLRIDQTFPRAVGTLSDPREKHSRSLGQGVGHGNCDLLHNRVGIGPDISSVSETFRPSTRRSHSSIAIDAEANALFFATARLTRSRPQETA